MGRVYIHTGDKEVNNENAKRLDTLIEWWGKDKADAMVVELFKSLSDEQKSSLAMKIAEAGVARMLNGFGADDMVKSVIRERVQRTFDESLSPQITKVREQVDTIVRTYLGERFPSIVKVIIDEMSKKATAAAIEIVSKTLPSRY